jgi:hypothetical protein
MGVKQIVKTTTNRGEFNRAYKKYLEVSKAELHCSYCRFHKGENYAGKWYGGYVYDDMETCSGKRKGTNTRYPNWKLVSKNPKQWMPKPIKIKERYYAGYQRRCVDIEF